MLPAQVYQVITLTADIFLFLFVGYFLFSLYKREKSLRDKETRMDSGYHHIVDDAMAKERKIIDDATHEADQIITGANYIKSGSQKILDEAIARVVAELKDDSQATARAFMDGYTASLTQLTNQSVSDFQHVVKGLETDLSQQIKRFHDSVLPSLEKELAEYKAMRLKQTDQMVTTIVNKASQEILNKTISMEDHHAILTASLEKAKKEGVFG
jgi:hypothetical protein